MNQVKPWLDKVGSFQVEHLPCPHFSQGVELAAPRTGVLHTTEGPRTRAAVRRAPAVAAAVEIAIRRTWWAAMAQWPTNSLTRHLRLLVVAAAGAVEAKSQAEMAETAGRSRLRKRRTPSRSPQAELRTERRAARAAPQIKLVYSP